MLVISCCWCDCISCDLRRRRFLRTPINAATIAATIVDTPPITDPIIVALDSLIYIKLIKRFIVY